MNSRIGLNMLAAGKHRNAIPAAVTNATGAYDRTARSVQEALVELLRERSAMGPGDSSSLLVPTMRDKAARMAGSDAALMGLKAVPAVAALAGLGLKEEDESFANQAMDLLGMGAGLYGVNRGINRLGGTTIAGNGLIQGALEGAALGGGLAAGNIGMNALQGLVGI